MTMRSKKYLFLLAVILFGTWCIKGYWSIDTPTHLTIVASGTRDDEFMKIDKVKEITSLKMQLARLRQKTSQCSIPDKNQEEFSDSELVPTIYAITPTHTRPVQKAELTRLSHTLMLVPHLHWVVVEDSETKTELVTKLLQNSGISFTHLNVATPKNWKLKTKEPRWSKPRGVLQRNVALDWIRENLSIESNDGVLYFLDDDNSYDLQVFEEMRYIKGVGVWPVGLVGGLMVERPEVNSKGKVVGWQVAWSKNRPFAIDMAGFAINLKLFLRTPEGRFAFEVEKGYQETELLKHFVQSLDDLEVRADNCTKVYVWHTRTETPALREEKVLLKQKQKPSNDGIEV